MELVTVKDAFDRVVKKQKLSLSRSHEVVDQVSQEVQQALTEIQSTNDPMSSVDMKSILSELKVRLDALVPLHQLECSQNELNTSLGKYSKVLEKSFNPDISKAYRNVDFDFHIVNQIIVNHLYRQGLFELGDRLINEAGEHEASAQRARFLELLELLEALKVGNLEPALTWASSEQEKLRQNRSNLEVKLHQIRFLEILKKGNQADAISYARTHLSTLASFHMDAIQKLMASVLWAGRLEISPYAEFTAPFDLDRLADELTRQFFRILGQPYKAPLNVSVSAGIEGLPTLLKLANIMAAKKHEWQEMKHLPVPVELGEEFQFHSIFVCPVSRDQSSEENPPMLLPCLHVLCKQSIMKLSKNNSSRVFKCPYCPVEATSVDCKRIFF